MNLEEIFEHGVSLTKMVWRKRGDKLNRQDVQRLVATDIHPRTYIEVTDDRDDS